MALHAAYGCVLSQQGIFGFRVIEGKGGKQFLPASGRVAIFAPLLESSSVRIGVTIGASPKLDVLVTRRPARNVGLVALLAGHLSVRASQGIASLRVIELLGGFPVGEVVALQAVVSKLPLVRIFVTCHAFLRESEERSGKIFHLDERTLGADHVHRRMALFTRNFRVLPFERIAGLPVIKLLLRWLPMNEREIRAIVLQMAPHAVFAIGILHSEPRVVAVLGIEATGNFFVAVQAFKRGRAGAELMATRALSCSCERLMRFGKRPRRDLAPCGS